MMLKISMCILVLIILCCSSSSPKLNTEKFDVPLLQKMEEVEKAGSGEEIKVFGKCEENITEQMKARIEETGTRVESIIGNIFTASATPASLKKLASLDFVTQIQLSTTSKPL